MKIERSTLATTCRLCERCPTPLLTLCMPIRPLIPGGRFKASDNSKAAGTGFKDRWAETDVDAADWWMLFEEYSVVDNLCDLAGRIHSASRRCYLAYMAVRLIEIRRVLKDTGSLWLHCDDNADSYLRLLLDAIFGQKKPGRTV